MMVTVKSIPEGVQALFPMLVCPSPEAEMKFCAAAFGAVEQVRRPGPDGSAVHIAMRINDAFLVDQSVERAVTMGAKILMPPQNQFWGDRTARIIDPSGHVWIVASRIKETTEGQRAQRWSDIREGR